MSRIGKLPVIVPKNVNVELNEKNLKSKNILLRLDLNVPLENGKISDTTRIDKILPTLKFLIEKNSKIST